MIKRSLIFFLLGLLSMGLSACDLSLGKPLQVNHETSNMGAFDRFFDDSQRKSITIVLTQQAWNQLDQSMIKHFEKFGDYRADQYVKANMIFEDEQGVLLVDEIGFRTRGNTSRGRIQDDLGHPIVRNFKLSFNEYVPKRSVFELRELDLKHARRDNEPYYDPTYLTEKFSLDLFRSFGVHSAYATLTRLYIQIDQTTYFYGIYTAFEPIDQNFIQRRYPDDSVGNLYKCLWQQYGPASLQTLRQNASIGIKNASSNYRPSYDIKTNKSSNRGNDLKEFIQKINTLKGDALDQYLNDHVDLDSLIRLLAIGVLLGNPDDYRAMGNNYYLYHHPLLQVWIMIPYDYDHGMGQGWPGSPVFDNHTIGYDIYEWGNLNKALLNQSSHPHPLTDPIFKHPELQQVYEAYLLELLETPHRFFQFDVFESLFNQQKALYQDGLDLALNSMPFDLRNVQSYMEAKRIDILNQIDAYRLHPDRRPKA